MSRRDEFVMLLLDRLMPPGSLLSRDPESNIGRLCQAPAYELERLEALAEFILADVIPSVTTLFLDDWERALGLPDCDITPTSTDERRSLVVEKLTRPRNLTAAMIESVCNVLGFAVTVTDTATPHQFEVTVASIVITPFTAGLSVAGDRLGAFGVEALECVLDHVKPAHTTYVLTTPP